MTLVLDAGALIGYDRGDLAIKTMLAHVQHVGVDVLTTAGVTAQVWRGGSRQARLALLLRGVGEVSLTRDQARRIGVLLGRARTADVVDASVVDIARDGDEILTSDSEEIVHLLECSGKAAIVTPV